MMWDYNGTWNSSDWVAMSLMMIVFFGLFILAVAVLMRGSQRDAAPSDSGPARETAEQLLANRFARGDIDEEDYDRRLAVLMSAKGQHV